jgi:hypothetical protein
MRGGVPTANRSSSPRIGPLERTCWFATDGTGNDRQLVVVRTNPGRSASIGVALRSWTAAAPRPRAPTHGSVPSAGLQPFVRLSDAAPVVGLIISG